MPHPCPGASETLLLLAVVPDSRGEAVQAGLLLPREMTWEVVFHVPCGWRAGMATSGAALRTLALPGRATLFSLQLAE